MISSSDKTKILAIPIEQVAAGLGITVCHHKALCPFHEDANPSLSFNTRSNRYKCFVCGATGNAIDLVMHTQRWNYNYSCRWMAYKFDIELQEHEGMPMPLLSPFTNTKTNIPVDKNIGMISRREPMADILYLSKLMARPRINAYAAEFLYNERKISPSVVTQLGLSSISHNCPMSSAIGHGYFDGPALLIPYRDAEGHLTGVQSRYLGRENKPRFRFPRGCRCHVFNIDSLKGLDSCVPVYITEGVTDCLAMLSAGVASVAIPSATLLVRQDVQLLAGHRLHMFPDADEPGEKLFEELKTICPQLTRHNLPKGFKDVGQYYSFINK